MTSTTFKGDILEYISQSVSSYEMMRKHNLRDMYLKCRRMNRMIKARKPRSCLRSQSHCQLDVLTLRTVPLLFVQYCVCLQHPIAWTLCRAAVSWSKSGPTLASITDSFTWMRTCRKSNGSRPPKNHKRQEVSHQVNYLATKVLCI